MMAIDPNKLNALKSLATGGSPGLNAYRQAQQAESTSRTSALQKAIGGIGTPGAEPGQATTGPSARGVAEGMQAQYAPSVGSDPFADAGNLQAAANQYLSQGAKALSDDAYRAQQNLLLEQESANRASNAKNLMNQLQGAADIYGQKQLQNVAGTFSQDAINMGLAKRAELQKQLDALNASVTPVATAEGMIAQANNPEAQAQIADLQAQIAANDQATKEAFGRYAGALGRDTRGLEETYASGNADQMQGLLQALGQEAAPAQAEAERAVQASGQERLRELAPAFGIDPLTAAGMFRQAEEKGPQEAAKQSEIDQYVAGVPTAKQQKAVDQQQASDLGFATGNDYAKAKRTTKMNDQEITSLMNSDDWNEVSQVANAYMIGDESVTGDRKGIKGFQATIQDMVKGGHDLVDGKEVPWDDAKKERMIKLANAYFNSLVAKAAGTGTVGETE